MKNKYLQVYKERHCLDELYLQVAMHRLNGNTLVVIPCYKESFKLVNQCLLSLNRTTQVSELEVMILVNYKSTDSPDIKTASEELYSSIIKAQQAGAYKFLLRIFISELSHKKSGVGLARKLLMDCAFLRFQQESRNGLIVNLDADTVVSTDYLTAISAYFAEYPEMEAASIAFEHPTIEPTTHESFAIINYELHLRYFINMQRWLNLPFAFQTIGSAMAVRSDSYAKEGGMVLKQAGEDFYFLHKFSKNFLLGEINTTVVTPSNRSSDRVPFGTGKAVNDFISTAAQTYYTYNPDSFIALKGWLQQITTLLINPSDNTIPKAKDDILASYLQDSDYNKVMSTQILNTKIGLARAKKFYEWFDAFRLMKYLHYSRINGNEDLALLTACHQYSELTNSEIHGDELSYLQMMRRIDRSSDYNNQWRAGFISKLSKISAS